MSLLKEQIDVSNKKEYTIANIKNSTIHIRQT